MKLSTRGRYGLRFMIELALNSENKPILLKKISENQGISLKYLEQIAILLRNAGLIKSFRGQKGGYVLARPPENITITEILKALEGEIAIVDCVKFPKTCERFENCPTVNLWKTINDKIVDYLNSTTLKDLAGRE